MSPVELATVVSLVVLAGLYVVVRFVRTLKAEDKCRGCSASCTCETFAARPNESAVEEPRKVR